MVKGARKKKTEQWQRRGAQVEASDHRHLLSSICCAASPRTDGRNTCGAGRQAMTNHEKDGNCRASFCCVALKNNQRRWRRGQKAHQKATSSGGRIELELLLLQWLPPLPAHSRRSIFCQEPEFRSEIERGAKWKTNRAVLSKECQAKVGGRGEPGEKKQENHTANSSRFRRKPPR